MSLESLRRITPNEMRRKCFGDHPHHRKMSTLTLTSTQTNERRLKSFVIDSLYESKHSDCGDDKIILQIIRLMGGRIMKPVSTYDKCFSHFLGYDVLAKQRYLFLGASSATSRSTRLSANRQQDFWRYPTEVSTNNRECKYPGSSKINQKPPKFSPVIPGH